MAESVITWSQLEKHIYYYDCWVLIAGKVYNVTDFLVEHPGGDAILLKYSGRDSTQRFEGVPHSEYAISLRNARLVGSIESADPPQGYLDRIAAKKKEVRKKDKPLVIRTDKISREQVALHRSQESCWIIMHNKVYDVTTYLQEHPGGVNKIMMYAGQDATEGFDSQMHSEDASRIKEKYYIGQLEPKKGNFLILLILLLVTLGGLYCFLNHS